jgi:L-amino acid N-acyltransferase YncA
MRYNETKIRSATTKDHAAIWNIFRQIIAAGDTYAFDANISREEALAYWFRADTHTYIAERNGDVVGTYILRPNQSGPGSHVANAAFMVARDSEGFGVGRTMAEHCLSEAQRMGFRGIQFNFVVSTNVRAIHLWKQLGFKIVGTLPGAFRHPEKGFVDVYVMFRSLLED